MRRKIWGLVGLLLLVGVGITVVVVGRHMVRTSPTMAKKVGQPLPVQVVEAQQVALTEVLGATGEVQPIALVNLTAPTSARVEKVAVDVGEVVAPKQVLMQFDRKLPESRLRVARTSVNQAAGELERVQQYFQRIKAVYEQGLSHAVLETARTSVDHAAGELERAQQYFQRIKAVYEQKLLPKIDVEKAQAAVAEAKVRYSEAQEKLLQARKDLQTEVEKAQAAVAEAKVRYSEAQDKLVQTTWELQQTTVESPVLGVVMERQINPGETPPTNQTLLTVGQIDQIVIEAKIAEERVADIYLQQPATVTLSAFPNDAFAGEVVKIKPVTDPETRTFLVYVKVVNADLKLKPGLSSFVRIKRKHQGLAVPSIALIKPTGVQDSAVFVVGHDGRARLRKIKAGVVTEGMTEVVDGLAAGDRVVVVGQFHLQDGYQVRIGDEFDEVKTKFVGPHGPKGTLAAEQP